MVLDLYIHQAKGRPTSITGACIGSHAPATTALRYIDLLCEMGWVEKIPDDNDRRRSLLALTGWSGPSVVAHPPVWPGDHRVTPGDAVTLINLSPDKGGRPIVRLRPERHYAARSHGHPRA